MTVSNYMHGHLGNGGATRPLVSLIECRNYHPDSLDAALDRSIELLGGIEKFVRPGQKVFLKPNLLLAANPERAATTHPLFVAAAVRLVQRAGALPFFGDLPGGFHVGTTKKIYRVTGMDAAAEQTGATLVKLEAHGFRKHLIPDAKIITEVHVPKFLDDVDVIINLPKPKTHMQSKYTGAVKNLFGFVTTADRVLAHKNLRLADFSTALAEIFSIFRPALTLMDAVTGMEGAGPSQGAPVRLGFIAASRDAVALDAIVTSLLGYAPKEVLTTRAAAAMRLGSADLSSIRVVGDPPASFRKNIKKPPPHVTLAAGLLSDLANRLTDVRPVIRQKKCEKCGTCAAVCPVQAISSRPDFLIDPDACIRCFCCHEVCPHSAIELKEAPLARLAKRMRS
ncbi:MAG: DUF362 domain-containing protein [bacterium]